MTAPTSNPFPGLRPFRQGEEELFFGREAQVDVMVDALAKTRLLAVVGTSGSGKSSLVNCGLIPALHRGLMARAGSAWRVASLRPGHRPIRALATAIAAAEASSQPELEDTGFSPWELVEATLRLSRLGLVDAFEQAKVGAPHNLLVLVDQFEELFRFEALASDVRVPSRDSSEPRRPSEEATAFVNLLLAAGAQQRLPIFVVLTMRSDFLGDCARFFGLPEALNRGQYLVPRLTRDERREAIEGPIRLRGQTLDPALLTRLVNDVGDDPDQLSILQHALNRTWTRWEQAGARGPITLEHYEAGGTMAHALNQHAEEAYDALGSDRLKHVCELLFKAITDQSSDARGTRRPTLLGTLVEITGASAEELTAVIDVFRDPARSFLMPPAGQPLGSDTPIDISHESLMRIWSRLRGWASEEAVSAQTFRALADTAELRAHGDAELLRNADLRRALS